MDSSQNLPVPVPPNSPSLPPSLPDVATCPGHLTRQTTEGVDTSEEWYKKRNNVITASNTYEYVKEYRNIDRDMIMMTENGPVKLGPAKLGPAKLGPGLVPIISDTEKINALEKTAARQKEQISRLQSCVHQLIGILHDYNEYLDTFDKVVNGVNQEFLGDEKCKFEDQVKRDKESEEFQKGRLKSENYYEYMWGLNESEKDINLTIEQLEEKYGSLTLHDKSYVDKDGYVRRITDACVNEEYAFMLQYNYMSYKDGENQEVE